MNYNKVLVMGNLTRDPELKEVKEGMFICTFTIAINRKTKLSEEVCFMDIGVWGEQGKACFKTLKKGASAFIEGYLKESVWKDKDTGKERRRAKIVGEKIVFTGMIKDELPTTNANQGNAF